MFCPNCGKEIDIDSLYCSYCGVKISNYDISDNNVDSDKIVDLKNNNNFLEKYINRKEKNNELPVFVISIISFIFLTFLFYMFTCLNF